MNKQQASTLISTTFENAFDEDQYLRFLRELFNGQIDESDDRKFDYYGQYIPDSFKDYVRRYKRLGTYTDPDGHEIDLLIVILKRETSLDRARTMQRNFAAYHLKRREKETAIIAYTTEERGDWRFSMVRREPVVDFSEKGNLIAKDELTPVRRYSFLVGQNERSHTAQQQLFPILLDDKHDPTLDKLEEAFNIETVTKEFFERYKALFLQLKEELDRLIAKDRVVQAEFEAKELDTANFAKKLLGQIVFLYFLQKKGWLGVPLNGKWGDGPKNFLRQLFDRQSVSYDNFFDDVLEPLFYEALAIERDDNIYPRLQARIPFLNGGLFEPMNNYDWQNTAILIDNDVFEDIFDTFDLYNFTVREDEPLEKEVAVDPEMLGKVFENLLEVTDRKSKGAFYTPREIVHYMCQESLINYLSTTMGDAVSRDDIATFIRFGEFAREHDITTQGKEKETDTYSFRMPETIRTHATKLDEALANIKICDPAIGSGAFPVGMMQEIIKAREVLTTYIGESESRTTYNFKRQAIQESIYGVDIDSSAIDIAKLRLWLSLVVDEDDYHHIKPLPNLDYKIVCGNSLLSVQKDLFNLELFQQLEALKTAYFDQTDPAKKQAQRAEIDTLIAKLTGGHSTFDMQIYFSEVFHGNKGFDVVIGNPPYVLGRETFNSDIKEYLASNYKSFGGKYDLYIYFTERAISIVSPRSTVSYIIPNTLLVNENAKNLRKLILDTSKIDILRTFENRVFSGAQVESLVLILHNEADTNNDHEILVTSDDKTNSILQSVFRQKHDFRFNINTDLQTERLINKVKELSIPLGTICDSCIGIQLGGSSGNATKDSFISDKELDETYQKVLDGKEISRYGKKWLKRYVRYGDWLHRKRSQKYFVNPKIVIRQIGATPVATYDDEQFYTLNTIYNLILRIEHYSLKYVLAIINSKLGNWFWLKENSDFKTLFPKIKKAQIASIPIRKIKFKDPDFTALYHQIVEKVDVMLDLHKQLYDLKDSERAIIEKKIDAIDKEIDKLVYQAYELDSDDIALIEGSFSDETRSQVTT